MNEENTIDISNWVAFDVEKIQTEYKDEPTQVSIVDYNNNIIYETYVTPRGSPKSLIVKRGVARVANISKPYEIVREEIKEILKDKIIIGHDLSNEFRAFRLNESDYKTIDTAVLPIFKIITLKPRTLKSLTKEVLDRDIQTGKHSATEDAIATMDIVKKYKSYLNLDVPVLERDVLFAEKILNGSSKLKVKGSNGGSRKNMKQCRKRALKKTLKRKK